MVRAWLQARLVESARCPRVEGDLAAREVLGWSKRHKLAHAFRWEYSYIRLKLAQLLGQLGIFLTCQDPGCSTHGAGLATADVSVGSFVAPQWLAQHTAAVTVSVISPLKPPSFGHGARLPVSRGMRIYLQSATTAA